MSETGPHAPGSSPAEGRPDEELSIKGVVAFLVGVALLVLFAFVAMWVLSHVLKAQSIAGDPAPSPMAEARLPRARPRAALQADPTADMEKYRAEEDVALASYAWVDRPAGVARIPIARAIEIVAETGLPVPPPLPPAAPGAGEAK